MPPQEGWRPLRLSFTMEVITAATIRIRRRVIIIVPNIKTSFTTYALRGLRNNAQPNTPITAIARINPTILPLPLNMLPS